MALINGEDNSLTILTMMLRWNSNLASGLALELGLKLGLLYPLTNGLVKGFTNAKVTNQSEDPSRQKTSNFEIVGQHQQRVSLAC